MNLIQELNKLRNMSNENMKLVFLIDMEIRYKLVRSLQPESL